MVPEEIYAVSASSSKFQYSHPLNHTTVDDGALRARLAYDLMSFMRRKDCPYFISPDNPAGFDPHQSDDEVDILIVDGYYKEAEILIAQRLEADPDNEKSLFQQAFIDHLRAQYGKLLIREERALKVDPDNVNALVNKGFALANLGRENDALKVMDQVLAIDSENLLALGCKAFIAKNLGYDELREQSLTEAYNVTARRRLEEIERREAEILKDFGAFFIEKDEPSAFDEFNLRSGEGYTSIH
ncbi:MAG: tetratricopeptide repeat protein [Alphaproteobacteria bacterium]|nr:tetratricopeptide repeat protein [Alphaproteobacteria bacterium]MCB9974142.1 tetratricopeptide repeat protein [Rhodospirillales bacterium]